MTLNKQLSVIVFVIVIIAGLIQLNSCSNSGKRTSETSLDSLNKEDFTKYYSDENRLLDSITKVYSQKDWTWLKANYEDTIIAFFDSKTLEYKKKNTEKDDFDINKIDIETHKNTCENYYKETLENEIRKYISGVDFNIKTVEFLIKEAEKYSIDTNELAKFKFICNRINQAKMLLKGLETEVSICQIRDILKCIANNNCTSGFKYELTNLQKEKILNYYGKFVDMCRYDWKDALVLIDKMPFMYSVDKRANAIIFLLEEDIIMETSSGYVLNK